MDQWHRKYRDHCVDCYNYWQKWRLLNNEAIDIARSLADDRILLLDPNASAMDDEDFDIDLIRFRILDTCEKKARPNLEKFQSICSRLAKMESEMEALIELRSLVSDDRLMGSNLEKLIRLIKLLKTTCNEELKCKKAAFSDLPLAKSRDETMLCVACFVHQPFVNEIDLHLLVQDVLIDSARKIV